MTTRCCTACNSTNPNPNPNPDPDHNPDHNPDPGPCPNQACSSTAKAARATRWSSGSARTMRPAPRAVTSRRHPSCTTDLRLQASRRAVTPGRGTRYRWTSTADTKCAQTPSRRTPPPTSAFVAAVREVLAFLEAAAIEQTHGDSAVFLAELHLEGVPGALEPDVVVAELWRSRARGMGSSQLGGWEALRGDKLSRALRQSRDEL